MQCELQHEPELQHLCRTLAEMGVSIHSIADLICPVIDLQARLILNEVLLRYAGCQICVDSHLLWHLGSVFRRSQAGHGARPTGWGGHQLRSLGPQDNHILTQEGLHKSKGITKTEQGGWVEMHIQTLLGSKPHVPAQQHCQQS